LHRSLFVLAVFMFCSCQDKKSVPIPYLKESTIKLKYAKGFSVVNFEDYSELHISAPWPNSSRTFKYALVKDEQEDQGLNNEFYDAIIKVPLERVVATSTTHIPALELLGVEKSLVGFPGVNYISSASLRERIKEGYIRELGQNNQLNTEVLLTLNPDVLIGFGIDGINKSFEILDNAGIPVIYNGDWTENTPLAKAEWIKFFGILYDKQVLADSIFSEIEQNYIEAKKLAQNASQQPTVLSGAMHKDVWYAPYGSSPEGQFLKDANVRYLWENSSGSGSQALSFETVFLQAKDADIWINPSNFTSYEQLRSTNKLYTKFKAFRDRSIYSFSLTKGPTGGVLYYELGMSRPDLILKDLIKVCHPDLLEGYQTSFFKPLLDEGR
jgi:iron complex transport system substrate-binding protein